MVGGKYLSNLRGACTRWGRCFLAQRAATYLAWYALSILVFALIYCALPGGSFYAPYAAREPRTGTPMHLLRFLLAEKMRDGVQAWSDDNFVDFNMSDISIQTLDVGQDRDAVRISISAQGNAREGRPQQDLTLDIAKWGNPVQQGFCHEVRLAPDRPPPADPYLLDVLFHEKPACGFQHYMLLDPDEQQSFRRHVLGASGQPKLLDRYGGRMISFSAQTITTTSFGDIVPLCRRARALTAIEPIWGFFLLGLALRASLRRADQDGSAGQ